ncbi:hypothetical protein [Actinokineospora diospyrosa]|uniref:Uncharacterized protein n=1 Tax=Actinokineospora diospyrosa TaxID=103728 RepID=A0ABT1IDE2_9PSEU|nr:hypothetical protein [Actinokineospora diospyrosa]MCP2270376.1 hypothetical protein [Actinokineospora diospyrosa]
MSSVVLFVVVALAVPMVVAECGEVSPWLARKVLGWAARRLRPPDKAERYTEEWLADLEEVPGKLTKLGWALGVAFLGVLRLREPKHSLDWTPRPVASPFATDSVFGPASAQPARVIPQQTAPHPPAIPSVTRSLEPVFPEPDYLPRRRAPEPQPWEPPHPGSRFFQRYYDNWGNTVHVRRYAYDEDPEVVYGATPKAAPPVIGD